LVREVSAAGFARCFGVAESTEKVRWVYFRRCDHCARTSEMQGWIAAGRYVEVGDMPL
jgi:hypothetical protein